MGKINGKWYLFDSEGWMLYDWKLSGDYWYYLGNSDDGSMKSGWLLKNNKWYYLGDSRDGSMKTGWQKIMVTGTTLEQMEPWLLDGLM